MTSDNEDIEITRGGHICHHLLESDGHDPYVQFTGVEANYNLICTQCKNNLDKLSTTLRYASPEKFEEMDRFPAEGIIGQPEILQRASNLSFVNREIQLDLTFSGQIRSVAPKRLAPVSQWVALFSSGEIALLDFEQQTVSTLAVALLSDFTIAENSALHLSADGRFAAVVNDREPDGIVLELATGTVTMRLNRGSYHAKQTRFPAVFFQHYGQTLLVHATDWNRLDTSNPATGELLTTRISPEYEDGKRGEHDLDYFHALPLVSPDASWIAEDGWVWQPFGLTRLWNLQRWLSENVWESEDGSSVKYLNQRGYYWNGPLCWIDDKTLAVWGFGDDDEWLIPAIQLFDAETGKRTRLFAGPRANTLYFDEYLFAISSEGTEVWDVETGERLHTDENLTPTSFHPRTHEFLSVMDNGVFLLSRLINTTTTARKI